MRVLGLIRLWSCFGYATHHLRGDDYRVILLIQVGLDSSLEDIKSKVDILDAQLAHTA